MDELAWRRAKLGGWKEPLRISFEPYCGESGFAYSCMGRSCSWKMSPPYCAARDTGAWIWGHSLSQLIRQTIWWREEIPRKVVSAHALKYSFPWRRELAVCLRHWAPGGEILPNKRKGGEKRWDCVKRSILQAERQEFAEGGLEGFRGSWPVPLEKQNKRGHIIQACKTEEDESALEDPCYCWSGLLKELPCCQRWDRVNSL